MIDIFDDKNWDVEEIKEVVPFYTMEGKQNSYMKELLGVGRYVYIKNIFYGNNKFVAYLNPFGGLFSKPSLIICDYWNEIIYKRKSNDIIVLHNKFMDSNLKEL